MKEDVQLSCPISYHDPSGNVWSTIQQGVCERLPLRDISWKSTGTVSLSQATVDKLPIRFMPSTASLFKDADHAFRWFVAPYANIFFVNADSLESYKEAKVAIKKWVETVVGFKRASWLLVYAPINVSGKPPDATVCAKVYAKLCSDFYVERTGDRSVNFVNVVIASLSTDENVAVAYDELFCKVKEGVVVSFLQRSALYDSDIRRLDSFRGSQQYDFRHLFLVKESLALMYQIMQLPQEALRQYGELEALLGVVPHGTLPSNDWPLIVPEELMASAKSGSFTAGSPIPIPDNPALFEGGGVDGLEGVEAQSEFERLWKYPMGEGEALLLYSINSARIRILKNKIGLRELRRYVFSRQMHFLAQQHKCREFASKGLQYITDTYAGILQEITFTPHTAAERRQQADLWAVSAAVKVVRACRVLLSTQSDEIFSPLAAMALPLKPANTNSRSVLLAPKSPAVTAAVASAVEGDDPEEATRQQTAAALRREVQLLQTTAVPLSELLRFGYGALHSLYTALNRYERGPDAAGVDVSGTDQAATPCTQNSADREQMPRNDMSRLYYTERALSLAQALTPFHFSTYSASTPALGRVTEQVRGAPMTSLGDEMCGVRSSEDGPVHGILKDFLQGDMDQVLGCFSSHLSSALAGDDEGEMDGAGGGVRGATAATPTGLSVWCPLSVLLLRCVSSHEEVAGRYRTASRARLDCADLLLCHDHLRLARDCYLEGVGRGKTCRTGPSRVGCVWGDVERAALSKILYCSAASNRWAAYMQAAVLLRAVCVGSFSGSAGQAEGVEGDGEGERYCRAAVGSTDGEPHTLTQYFEVAADVPLEVLDASAGEVPVSPHSHPTVTVRPEGLYCVLMSVRSLFPCTVRVHQVSVLYEALTEPPSPSPPPSASAPEPAPFPHSFYATCLSDGLDGGQGHTGIILSPDTPHTLSLHFTAPSAREGRVDFAVSEIRVLVLEGGEEGEGESVCFLQKIEHSGVGEGVEEHSLDCAADDAFHSAESSILSRFPVISVAASESLCLTGRAQALQPCASTDELITPSSALQISMRSPLLLPPPPLPSDSVQVGDVPTCPLLQSRVFLQQIELRNAALYPVEVEGVRVRDGVPGSEWGFSVRILDGPATLRLQTAGGTREPGPDLEAPLIAPGESYSLALRFILSPLSTETAPAAAGSSSLEKEGEGEGERWPSLVLSCAGQGVSSQPSGRPSKMRTEQTLSLSSSCRLLSQLLGSTTRLTEALADSAATSSPEEGEGEKEGEHDWEGEGEGADHYEASRRSSVMGTGLLGVWCGGSQRLLTKAMKTDRPVFGFPHTLSHPLSHAHGAEGPESNRTTAS